MLQKKIPDFYRIMLLKSNVAESHLVKAEAVGVDLTKNLFHQYNVVIELIINTNLMSDSELHHDIMFYLCPMDLDGTIFNQSHIVYSFVYL